MFKRRMKEAEKAVIAVLSYSAQFDHPLSLSEIDERLLTSKGLQTVDRSFTSGKFHWPATPLARKEKLAAILKLLVNKDVVIKQRQFFTLKGKSAAFDKRRQAALGQETKRTLVSELVSVVRRIPWIIGLAITGSHAAGGATAQDDVDFLVITENNRLWLARLFLLYYAWRRGRRLPLPNGDISHSWDLNFWLDETRLVMPARRRSVYEAYEVLQTRWVYNRQTIRRRFMLANTWVGEYLATWSLPKAIGVDKRERLIDPLSWFNRLAYWLEIGYRTLRHGRQRVDGHSAFFHPAQTRQNIILAWKSLYKRAIGQRLVLATGVFDVLHREHRNFLKAAKRVGDWLTVGLESDKRVKELKGTDRPINDQNTRLKNLRQWQIADDVFILPENFDQSAAREKLISQLRPQILAVSSSTPFLAKKRQVMTKFGGIVKVVYGHKKGVSSTILIKPKRT
jgi:cytidyltransferase-like protein